MQADIDSKDGCFAPGDADWQRDVLICLGEEDSAQQIADRKGAVLPPIYQASLHRRETMDALLADMQHEDKAFLYARGTNPTVAVLEARLAALERGEACKCFASGMGAISAALFALTSAGDHILFCGDIYGPALDYARQLERFGVSHSRCLPGDMGEIENAIQDNSRLIYMESPGSGRFSLLPLADIAALARQRGIRTVIDNTAATPLFQKPLAIGLDLVVHSASKYLGGHSDLVGGALIGPADLLRQIFTRAYLLQGAAMAPQTAWLILRAMVSLPLRMQRHSTDGLAIARFLEGHEQVERVFHPALDRSNSALFAAQMRGSPALVSFCPRVEDFSGLLALVNRLRHFGKAISWGGPESLAMCGHKSDPGRSDDLRIPWNMLRLSIGLEGTELLMADLDQALNQGNH